MLEKYIEEINQFLNECDMKISDEIYDKGDICKAKKYFEILKQFKSNVRNAWVIASEEKLSFIITNLTNHYYKKENTSINPEVALDLINGNSVTDYIVSLIKEKRLTDSKLIARFAYIELSKYLYYDISYTKINDLNRKSIIVNTPIDVHNTKIFSYVVCTQWLQLYCYIMSEFGIEVKKMKRLTEDHVWGEIEINENEIIIVDATDYFGNSIDLSNAKSLSPTKGFLILPKKYSGLKLYELFNNPEFKSTLKTCKNYYDLNRELDISLGYINSTGYPIEKILNDNDIFMRKDKIIGRSEYLDFLQQTRNFIINLHLPKNMDGYEAYAYYYQFIEKLPINIRGSISMKTLYVDSFDYKQKLLKKRYLNAPIEYIRYLEDLVYSRYYEYFKSPDEDSLFNKVKAGLIDIDEISDMALAEELKIAEINRRLNPFYAINELIVYNMDEEKTTETAILYEPTLGKKLFKSLEQLNQFKKDNNI